MKELVGAITSPLEAPQVGITSLMSDREQREEFKTSMLREIKGGLRNLDPFRVQEATSTAQKVWYEKINEITNPIYIPESLLTVMFTLADLDELITGSRFIGYDSSKKLDVLLDDITEFVTGVNSTNPYRRLSLSLSDKGASLLIIETKRGQDTDCVITFNLKGNDEVSISQFSSLKKGELSDQPFERGYQLNSLHLKPIERLLE